MDSKPFNVDIDPRFSVVKNLAQLERVLFSLTSEFEPIDRCYDSRNLYRFPAADFSAQSQRSQVNLDASYLQRQATVEITGGRRRRNPRILCMWDVDETLVCSGPGGLRQTSVFPPADLEPVFASMPANTRHLLISQGSIEDVFASDHTGKLRYLKKYFYNASRDVAARRAQAEDESDEDSGRADGGGGGGGIFGCCGVQERQANGRLADIAGNVEEGTRLIRIARIGAPCESEEQLQFLFDPNASPPVSTADDPVRWLVLRPCVYGISLASLSMHIIPSRHTAFVDGKVFRKMDVVWSFAASGDWDAVFFMDNNLSEIGIVRSSSRLKDMYRYAEEHHLNRFFRNDYLLLALSAKIRNMNRVYGRDVTLRPTRQQSENDMFRVQEARQTARASHLARMEAARQRAREAARANGKPTDEDDDVEEDVEVDAVISDDAEDRQRAFSPALRDSTLKLRNVSFLAEHRGDTVELEDSDEGEEGDTARRRGAKGGQSSYVGAECPTLPTRRVELVIAHFHMEAARYQELMRGRPYEGPMEVPTSAADGRRPRQGPRKREGKTSGGSSAWSAPLQPTFPGDMGCTDAEYVEVMSSFCQEERALYQLVDEEMRVNRSLQLMAAGQWLPHPRFVFTPRYPRPRTVPHMLNYYRQLCSDVEDKCVRSLESGGRKLEASFVVRSQSHHLYQRYQREVVFIDPLVTEELYTVLFRIYTAEGTIPKSMTPRLKKAVTELKFGTDPKHTKRGSKGGHAASSNGDGGKRNGGKS